MSKAGGIYDYDVVISYAGPDRDVAKNLADALMSRGFSVFFDLNERGVLWGKRLFTILADVFENRGRYCIVLISRSYRDRMWARHELQSAFVRAAKEKGGEYLLPIRIDDTVLEGMPDDVAYLSLHSLSIDEIADTFAQKVGKRLAPPVNDAVVATYADRLSAMSDFLTDIEAERAAITIVGHTLYHFIFNVEERISRRLIDILRAKCAQETVRIRVLLSHPDGINMRAVQEGRTPEALRHEQHESVRFLQEQFPAAAVGLTKLPPSYFAVLLSELLLLNTYPYQKAAFSSPTLVFRRIDGQIGPYELYAKDIEMLWHAAETIPSVSSSAKETC